MYVRKQIVHNAARSSLTSPARYHPVRPWCSRRTAYPHGARRGVSARSRGDRRDLPVTVDLRGVIGFSSFGVLGYYAIANAAAFTQPTSDRRWPRWLNLFGVAGCLTLIATLPWQSVLAGLAMFAVGLAGRAITLARRHRRCR